MRIKWAGFWVHLIFSVIGAFVAALFILFFTVSVVNLNADQQNPVVSSKLVMEIVMASIYFLFSLISIGVYYSHCAVFKRLVEFENDHNNGEPLRTFDQFTSFDGFY